MLGNTEDVFQNVARQYIYLRVTFSAPSKRRKSSGPMTSLDVHPEEITDEVGAIENTLEVSTY